MDDQGCLVIPIVDIEFVEYHSYVLGQQNAATITIISSCASSGTATLETSGTSAGATSEQGCYISICQQ